MFILSACGGGGGSSTPPPRMVSPNLSTINANPTASVIADGITTSTITVTVLDTKGQPFANRPVSISASGTSNTLLQTGSTDSNGIATGGIASTIAELKTLTAIVDPGPNQVAIANQGNVTFIADASAISAGLSTVNVNPASDVIADGSQVADIEITLRDVNGNLVPAQPVQINASGSMNSLVQPGPSDTSGMAMGSIASTLAETKTLTVTVNPGPNQIILLSQPSVGFVGDPANIDANLSSLSAAPSLALIADGVDSSTLSITVRDVNGNPVAAQNVQLTSDGSNNSILQPGPSDAGGATSGSMASTTAETKTVTATINPGPSQVQINQQPSLAFIGDPATVNASNSSLVMSPTSGVVADGTQSSLATITVRDVNGNPVSGQLVSLASSGFANSILPASAVSDANGLATANITSLRAETKTITATINPGPAQVVVTQQGSVQFIADASSISASLSSASALPATSVAADGTSISTISVTLLDVNSNPVAGQSVQISADGILNSIVQPSSSDAAGQASGTIASTAAQTKTITVTANPGPSQVVLVQKPTVAFVGNAAAISATGSSVIASPDQELIANGLSQSTVTITVRDTNGNPVPGQSVQIAVGGGSNLITQPLTLTDGNGVTTARLASTLAEIKSISATVNPGPGAMVLSQQPLVEFIGDANNISATNSSAVALPLSGVITNGIDQSSITVIVRDVNNNPVPQQTVNLAATGTGNSLTQPPLSDALGRAVGSIASTVAETKTLTATVNPGPSQVVLTQQPSVGFDGDPSDVSPGLSSLVVNPSSNVLADGVALANISITVRDGNGNPLPGQTVLLSSDGSNNTIVQPGPTDAAGMSSGSIASTNAETKTIIATVNPGSTAVQLSSRPSVEFVGDPSTISAANSLVSATPISGLPADGSTSAVIQVTVLDANGNPVSGQSLQIDSSGTNNSITQAGAVSDAQGQASGSIASTMAESKTITVTVNPGPSQVVLIQQPSVSFVGDPASISATGSTVSASPSTGLIADGADSSTITITVLDANSNPVPGQTLQLSISGSSNSIIQPGLTDALGMSTGMVASGKAEGKTVTVTVNPGPDQVVLTQQPSLSFVGDASNLSAGLSTALASPSTGLTADGSDSSTITVTVLDANGNPVSGQAVQIAASGSGNTITQPGSATDSSGLASGSITSTVAESKTLTLTINPGPSQLVLSSQPLLTFVGDGSNLSASLSTASASPDTGLSTNGSDASTVTVTVRDINGNLVSGQTVQIAADGTGNSITQPATTSNGNGSASGTIASSTAETKTITITLNPGPSQVVLSQQPTVEFLGDASNLSAGLSTAIASPSSGLVADGIDSSTITVTVRDGNGNPVAGQSVQISSDGSSNTILQPAISAASGVTSGSIASSSAETKTITITLNPGPSQVVLSQQPTVEFLGDASNISASNSSLLASPISGISADGLANSTITITVRDSNGNPIPGQTLQLSASGSGNSLTQPAAITDGNGMTSGSIASTVAEIKTITAIVNPGPAQITIDQQPRLSFDPLLDLDDGRLVYAESSLAAAHQRDWLAGSSAWGSESSTASGAADILWTQNRMRPLGWYRKSWTARKQLTIASALVSGSTDLQNFPLLIAIDDSDLAGSAQADGDDILFTAANGTTQLAHEIESYAAGVLVAWVSLPILSASQDTTIFLYYGDPSASNQENAAAVWSHGYAAVWHLAGSYSGTPNEVIDSSGNGNHGQAGTAPTQSTGRIGMGQDFESGNSEYLQVDHGGNLDFAAANSQFTISAWVRPESLGAWQSILSKGAASPFDQWLGLDNSIPGVPGFELDSSVLAATGTLSSGSWTYLAFTWDHLDMRVQINGVDDVSSLARILDLSDSSDTSYIGAIDAGAGDPFDGVLDEVRVSAMTRSSDWLRTEFNNQSDPGAFSSLGSEEDFASDDGEELMAVLSDTGAGSSLDFFSGSNGNWSLDWNSTAIAQAEANKRGFALAYEDSSGEALAVYTSNTNTPRYRSRSSGSWSSEQPLPLNDGAGHNPDPNTGIVLWTELASRPGTDEITLLYLDANRDLIAIVWDGSQWLTNSAVVLETEMKINASSGELSNRNFDLAYVEQTGQLMTAWSRESDTGFWYSTKTAGSSNWSTAAQISSAPGGGIVHFVDLAAEPQGTCVAGAFFDMGDGTERLGLATWDGSSWINPGEYDSQTRNVNDSATGDFFGAVGWVGTSGKAICVYSDNNNGDIDWASWTSGAGWAIETDVPIAGKGFTESVLLHSYRGQDRVLLLISDSADDLWSASYDGSTWSLGNAGSALETDLSAIDTRPFSLSLKPH